MSGGRERGSDSDKRSLLGHSEPSAAAGIADAAVIKDDDLFFLSRHDGSVPIDEQTGLGLYRHDCRFLSGYQLLLDGAPPEALGGHGADVFRSSFQLTNRAPASGRHALERQRLGVKWRHVIDAGGHRMIDAIEVESYLTTPVEVQLSLRFATDFRDVFVIRGLAGPTQGRSEAPVWSDRGVAFAYLGEDDDRRELRVGFSRPPDRKSPSEAIFTLRLDARGRWRLVVTLEARDVATDGAEAAPPADDEALAAIERAISRSHAEWMDEIGAVRSDHPPLDATLRRSFHDLRALRSRLDQHHFVAAGLPWFGALFGRDSAVCALETVGYRASLAGETLRLLAHYQGKGYDAWRDEEPGRILHALRVGELARLHAIPHTPFYGSVDATPLFVILLAEYLRWSGDLALVRELEGPLESALAWMLEIGDHDGDGYVDYDGMIEDDSLVNQGWKDSGNAIVDARGQLAPPPIALVEVQAYVFRALRDAAELVERCGQASRAATLRREAEALRARFERDFWVEDKGCYALARADGGRLLDVVSSNPGHTLWTGIASPERARRLTLRLLEDDMESGWGIRTLASSERAYNPVAYHLGTVWPHDNALIAAGMRRYGFDAEACRIFDGLLAAASRLRHHRLPEVFAGYPRGEHEAPVHYPVACKPQAWATGALPYLLHALVGLEPDALARRLHIVRPCLPPSLGRVELERVRVGEAEVGLRFVRDASGAVTVDVTRRRGELEVVVTP